jgi:hypothetical protein
VGDGGELVSADTSSDQAADVAMIVDDTRPWRNRTERARRHAQEPNPNLEPVGEAQIHSTLQVLWALEREELHRMTDTAIRATRLDDAWVLKPDGMTFADFKAANPLWAHPFRLWSSTTLTSWHRLCLHRYAGENHLGHGTTFDTQIRRPQDKDKIMTFFIEPTAEEWASFQARQSIPA